MAVVIGTWLVGMNLIPGGEAGLPVLAWLILFPILPAVAPFGLIRHARKASAADAAAEIVLDILEQATRDAATGGTDKKSNMAF